MQCHYIIRGGGEGSLRAGWGPLINKPNVQIDRYYSRKNQHQFNQTRSLYPQKVNVLVRILGHHIRGQVFLNKLQSEIEPALDDVPEDLVSVGWLHKTHLISRDLFKQS